MSKHYRTQLPNSEELKEILSREAKRDLSSERINDHFPVFTTLIKVLDALDLDSDFFKKDYAIEDLDNSDLYDKADEILNEIAERVGEVDVKLLNDLYDYLAEEDTPIKADYIFVFGSKSNLRIEKAVELWKARYAPKIIISGSMPIYDQRD